MFEGLSNHNVPSSLAPETYDKLASSFRSLLRQYGIIMPYMNDIHIGKELTKRVVPIAN